MASSEQQQHALDVLKGMNKAITTLRLYPEQSVQVGNTIETAYSDLKQFIRLYKHLSLSLEQGVPALDGVIFDRNGREQLNSLSMVDMLNKAGFEVMILGQGIDRKRFKQILSFFTANPEQIAKAGGHEAFVRSADLAAVFMSDREKNLSELPTITYNVTDYLKILTDAGVRRDDFSLFLAMNPSDPHREKMRRALNDQDKVAHILAAAVCFSLQTLQQQGVYGPSSHWPLLSENINLALKDERDRQVVMGRLAHLLTKHLDSSSLLLLCCQEETLPLFSLLIESCDKVVFRSLVEFQRQEADRLSSSLNENDKESLVCVDEVGHELMQTVPGRQFHAAEVMGMTEQQRQSKRLYTGLNALARGDLDGLRNKEVLQHLPETFLRLMQHKKEPVAAAIIQTLVKGLKLAEEDGLQLQAGKALGLVGERLLYLQHWEWLEKLTPSFLFCLKMAEEADELWNRCVSLLQRILTHAQHTNNEILADKILALFYAIRSGAAGKTEAMRKILGQVQDQAVDVLVLQSYLDQCCGKPINGLYCQKIILHGPLGIHFLLDAISASDKRSVRIRLLKILTGVGDQLAPLLVERLQKPMPWHGKRNLIRLLAATGSEEHIGVVRDYLSHEDLRVQSEALLCVNNLSGGQKKQELLAALPRISEKLKFQAVQALAAVVDEEVVTALVELLRDEKYFSADIKNQLLVSVCETLGRSGSVQAQKALLEFTGKAKVRPKRIAESVWQAAQKGLALLDSYRRQQKQGLAEVQKKAKNLLKQVATAHERPVYAYMPVTELAEENEVYSLLDQNRLVEARKRLLNLIITLSYLHQLDQAEILRQRLVEIDPLAIDDILYASELIEEQRDAGAEHGHGVSWSEVYDCLSTEEFNNLYASMEFVSFVPDTNMANQGAVQQQLFFINKGRVKLFHRDAQGNDILLQIIGPGGVVGADSFFKDSVWTVSAASVGMVDALVLSREGLRKWQALYPDLESKMEKFCLQNGESDSSRMMAVERRQQERWNFSGQLAMTMIDEKGREVGFDLLSENGDISIGGMCCLVRVAQNKSLRSLLGRRVRVRLPELVAVNPLLAAGKIGVVVALFRQADVAVEVVGQVQFSVHIQFDQVLQESDLAGVQIVS